MARRGSEDPWMDQTVLKLLQPYQRIPFGSRYNWNGPHRFVVYAKTPSGWRELTRDGMARAWGTQGVRPTRSLFRSIFSDLLQLDEDDYENVKRQLNKPDDGVVGLYQKPGQPVYAMVVRLPRGVVVADLFKSLPAGKMKELPREAPSRGPLEGPQQLVTMDDLTGANARTLMESAREQMEGEAAIKEELLEVLQQAAREKEESSRARQDIRDVIKEAAREKEESSRAKQDFLDVIQEAAREKEEVSQATRELLEAVEESAREKEEASQATQQLIDAIQKSAREQERSSLAQAEILEAIKESAREQLDNAEQSSRAQKELREVITEAAREQKDIEERVAQAASARDELLEVIEREKAEVKEQLQASSEQAMQSSLEQILEQAREDREESARAKEKLEQHLKQELEASRAKEELEQSLEREELRAKEELEQSLKREELQEQTVVQLLRPTEEELPRAPVYLPEEILRTEDLIFARPPPAPPLPQAPRVSQLNYREPRTFNFQQELQKQARGLKAPVPIVQSSKKGPLANINLPSSVQGRRSAIAGSSSSSGGDWD